jgi:hypothetical protein
MFLGLRECVRLKTEEFKALTASIKEMSRNHVDMASSIGAAANSVGATNKLWKSGNKSFLIKAGLALVIFPEPVVSDMLGTALLAAGAVQEGIKRQSIYLDDLPKAFHSAMKDLKATKESI